MLFNYFFIGNLSGKLMTEKDKRVKLMSDIIRGIRVIKFHVWEKYFIDKVSGMLCCILLLFYVLVKTVLFLGYRKLEVLNLKKRKYLDALCVYFWATTPVTISMLTFSTFILLGGQLTASKVSVYQTLTFKINVYKKNYILNYVKVFTSMALLHMLITPLNAFPWILNGVTEAWVSVKRIQRLIEVIN